MSQIFDFCDILRCQAYFKRGSVQPGCILTTLGGVFACPSYLLLDLSTTRSEAKTKKLGCFHVAVYILTPYNYIALCLATRFSERGRSNF